MRSLIGLRVAMYLTLLLVFALLFGILSVVGFFFGAPPVIFLFLAVGIVLFQWAIAPSVIRWATRMRYLRPGEIPWLEMMVSEMAKKTGVPPPRLAIVENPTPNAFVFGRTTKSATLAVHSGLLEKLDRDEIRAVIGHELGHLKHRDVTVMTIVSVVPILAFVIARSLFWSSLFYRRRDNSVAVALLFGAIMMVVYFISQLIILYLSRLREYYADAHSAMVTGRPMDLASALTKITYGLSLSKDARQSPARSFYIGDPVSARFEIGSVMEHFHEYDLNRDGVLDERELELALKKEAERKGLAKLFYVFSTHPPTYKRIERLKQIQAEMSGLG